MQLLVFSDNEFLMGILQGYGHVTGCEVKSLNDVDIFLAAIIKESPSMVFVDVILAEKIFSSPLWIETSLFIQKNKIALCGVGKPLPKGKKTAMKPVFNKIFTPPLDIDKVYDFLHDRILSTELMSHERRYTERRIGEERRGKDRRTGDRRNEDRRNEDRRKKLVEVESILNIQKNLKESLSIGAMNIDYSGKVITVDGTAVDISPKEFEIIDLLAQQPGCVIKTQEIVKMIWPKNYKATKADAHQYIHMLRKKIEKNPHEPQLLVTVKGFGYKLCP